MASAPSTVKEFSRSRHSLQTDDRGGTARCHEETTQLDAFRRALIVGKKLTEYQAALLSRGQR